MLSLLIDENLNQRILRGLRRTVPGLVQPTVALRLRALRALRSKLPLGLGRSSVMFLM